MYERSNNKLKIYIMGGDLETYVQLYTAPYLGFCYYFETVVVQIYTNDVQNILAKKIGGGLGTWTYSGLIRRHAD